MKEDLTKKIKIWQVIVLIQLVGTILLSLFVAQQQRIMTAQNMTMYELRLAVEDRDQKLLTTLTLLQRAAEEIGRTAENEGNN